MERIAYLLDLLEHPEKIDGLIREDCAELKQKYGDARRTRVYPQAADDINEEDLVPHQAIVVTISDRGYTKRVPLDTYRSQGRGGRGVTGVTTREEDAVRHLLVCDTHDSLLLFTAAGKVYSLKGHEAPEASRQARGIPIVNLIDIEPADRVTTIVVVSDFARDSMVLATASGEVKRTPLDQFESVRRAGLIAMNLKDGDRLVQARAAGDHDEAILVSSGGRAIRFQVGSLRVASRASGGVRGMRLPSDGRLIGLVIDSDGEDLLVVSELGVGKRTPIGEYPTKGRGGQGVLTFRVTRRSGPLAVARAIRADQEVILISREGIVMRTGAESISRQGRGTQGVSVMHIEEGDTLAAIAQISLDATMGNGAASAAGSPSASGAPLADEPLDDDIDGGIDDASDEDEAADDEA